MALINCPDCSNSISDQAAACPHCGHPVKAIVIEATAKKWKKMQLVGSFLLIATLVLIVTKFTFVSNVGPVVTIVLGLFFWAGLILYVYGRFKAWWHHR